MKERDTQVQEVQRVPNKLDPKKPTLRHSIMKLTWLKDEERILKIAMEKQVVTYKENKLDCHLITQQKHFRPEGSSTKYSR